MSTHRPDSTSAALLPMPTYCEEIQAAKPSSWPAALAVEAAGAAAGVEWMAGVVDGAGRAGSALELLEGEGISCGRI